MGYWIVLGSKDGRLLLHFHHIMDFNDLAVRIEVINVSGIRPTCNKIFEFFFGRTAIGPRYLHHENPCSGLFNCNICHVCSFKTTSGKLVKNPVILSGIEDEWF